MERQVRLEQVDHPAAPPSTSEADSQDADRITQGRSVQMT